MNKQTLTIGGIGILIGILIAMSLATTAVNNNNQRLMKLMGMTRLLAKDPPHDEKLAERLETEMSLDTSMEDIMEEIRDKHGDEFDRAFISGMIIHHQGAIEMANEALKNAKHQEIKDLSNQIISAQSSEIELMRKWQSGWVDNH